MELTKEWINGKAVSNAAGDAIWQAIEADRQRVRDEAIAEVKKDHFRIGDEVEMSVILPPYYSTGWRPAKIVATRMDVGDDVFMHSCEESGYVRRPPKTRPLTDMEKAKAWTDNYAKKYPGNPWEKLSNILLSGATIDDACKSDDVPTEVPE